MVVERFMLYALTMLFAVATSSAALGEIRGEPVQGSIPVGNEAGDPTDHLPAGTRLISSFGERPAFSPDGRRVAFIGASYGDAFEYDIATGRTRNLTVHAPHGGFLRVHYLPDGSFLLLGPHAPAATREETRFGRVELWWMDAKATRPPVRLGVTLFEGLAVSRSSNRIAWAEVRPRGVPRPQDATGTVLIVGEVVVEGGTARVDSVRELLSKPMSDCTFEAQDFLPGDRGLTMACYEFDGSNPSNPVTRVISVDFATRKISTYPTPRNLYGEVEGIFPDGRRALVECAEDRTAGMDLCLLELKTKDPAYTRLTRIQDYGRWKYGNPVVRRDGRMIAAQIGPADVIDAGVGAGIVLIDLPEGF